MPRYEVTVSRTETRTRRMFVSHVDPVSAKHAVEEAVGDLDFHDGTAGDPEYVIEQVREVPGDSTSTPEGTIEPQTLIIPAEVHSDDFNVQVKFDAYDWFISAGDDAICDLVRCGWGGDYPADEVARYFVDSTTRPVFDYLARGARWLNGDTMGFECYVDPKSAMSWLEKNRPAVWRRINEANQPTEGP